MDSKSLTGFSLEKTSNRSEESDEENDDWQSGNPESLPRISIDREAMDQETFHNKLQFKQLPKKSCKRVVAQELKKSMGSLRLMTMVRRLFPIITWLPAYEWRRDFISDASSGFTVAVMHIPQGMAYALLALVPPFSGIYTAIFPIIIYILMGTSKHESMGSAAISAILVAKTVYRYSNHDHEDEKAHYEPIQVATAVTFMTGLIQVLFGVFRFGTLCSLLSHSLVGGFTTGAAVHVLFSQIKHLLGISVHRFEGPFSVVHLTKALVSEVPSTNLVTLAISLSVLVSLELYSRLLEQRVTKLLRGITFPIHLLLVIIVTIVSELCDLEKTFGVAIVGKVMTGLPHPSFPPPELFIDVLLDSLVVAIISYVMSFSLGVLFAERYCYKVSAGQEFLAMGCSNMFGSLFMSLPISSSLSRTSVQDQSGCRTIMTSIVSIFCLLWVLLFAGPLFEPLPNAVLSTLIVHALRSTFANALELPELFHKSLSDFTVWIVTFWATTLLGVDLGLLVGVATNLGLLVKWTMEPRVLSLMETDFQDLTVDSRFFNAVNENEASSQSILMRIIGGINFLNVNRLKNSVDILIQDERKDKNYFIVDLSGVFKVDCAGCKFLKELKKRLEDYDVKLILTGIHGELWTHFKANGVLEEVRYLFPTTYDALVIINHKGDLDPASNARINSKHKLEN